MNPLQQNIIFFGGTDIFETKIGHNIRVYSFRLTILYVGDKLLYSRLLPFSFYYGFASYKWEDGRGILRYCFTLGDAHMGRGRKLNEI